MVSKRENTPDDFQAILERIAEDVLMDMGGLGDATVPAIQHEAISQFVASLGRSLRNNGLKLAFLNVIPGDVQS